MTQKFSRLPSSSRQTIISAARDGMPARLTAVLEGVYEATWRRWEARAADLAEVPISRLSPPERDLVEFFAEIADADRHFCARLLKIIVAAAERGDRRAQRWLKTEGGRFFDLLQED